MDQQDSTPGLDEGANASPQLPAEDVADNSAPSNQQPNDGADDNSDPNAPQDDSENQDDTDAGDSASVDAELTKWAESQNLQLNTETEIALAKRLRDTQKWAHDRAANNTKFDQIQDATAADSTEVLANKVARMDFWEAHAEDRKYESEMVDYVLKLQEAGRDSSAAHYADPQNWEELLLLSKAKASETTPDQRYENGRQDERENLAKAHRAARPSAAASSSTPQIQGDMDALVAKMSPSEYAEWRKTNNPFTA